MNKVLYNNNNNNNNYNNNNNNNNYNDDNDGDDDNDDNDDNDDLVLTKNNVRHALFCLPLLYELFIVIFIYVCMQMNMSTNPVEADLMSYVRLHKVCNKT